MSGLSSDELAEDYKASLEDLSFNSRYEISNLTVIARENIHAAQAIARVLERHISSAAPTRKLPALYLLDSIAKNVGTPYTLFFQRNLYSTFMDAYLVVESQVRRKLEEMLQTWKQPVPGSTSAQPVFSAEMTRKIDNALIKARTAALQSQQKQKQNQAALGLDRVAGRTPPPQQFRNTPPPIVNHGGYTNGHGFDYGRNGMNGQNTPVMNGAHHQQHVGSSGGGGIDTLQSDISKLIESCQMAISRDTFNTDIQARLKALVDLRGILQTQQLPEAQLALVRDQVRALAKVQGAQLPPQPPPPPPPPQLPLSTQDLASLLATATQTMSLPIAPQPPSMAALPVSLPPAPPPLPPASFGNANGVDAALLFASLQKSGLLPGLAAGLPRPQSSGPPSVPFPLPGGLPPGLPRSIIPTHHAVVPPPLGKRNWRSIDVELKTQSLKIPRPHLIPMLSETLPNKCSSCARRFEDSEKGRREKASHLDWHFRVHQRTVESSKRGQNRVWYVGEEEWIKSRDDGEDIASVSFENNNTEDAESAAQAKSEEVKKQYVVVPDSSETHKVCPICQEELKYVWHDETDEFVWMDAKQVGGRIYHASCHAEASKDRASGTNGTATNSRGATPDTGSGMKRKAEGDDLNPKVKIKKEPM
ncbi:hypothetical protein EDC01DRAFT_660737 [Geopyxis carbonaria]|nr:hypothetical protein EDC01DRAFT_660737 [Geopyxis carbonaria]